MTLIKIFILHLHRTQNFYINFYILLIASIFFCVSALYVIGHYQSQNGDFGQYFIHAQNLLKGRDWSFSLEGYPAVLPLYPYLIAIITYIFGVNAFYYALLNTLMWAITCATWSSIYSKRFSSLSVAPLYMLFITFLPFVVAFQQEALPNIMFAMCCALSFKAMMKCEEHGFSLGSIVLVLLPALVRVESLAFFSAYILYFLLNRKYSLSILGVAGTVLTIVIDICIGLNYGMKSNFSVLHDFSSSNNSVSESSFYNFFVAVLHLASSYLVGLGEMFIPSNLIDSSRITLEFSDTRLTSTSYFSFLVLLIFLMGFLKRENFFRMDFLVFLSLLGLISLFPLPEAPIRYLLPIFPIYAFYLLQTLVGMVKSGVSSYRISIFFSLLMILPLFWISLSVSFNEPKRRNFLFNKYTTEMADWVSENRNERTIAFFKPRLMVVLMDIRNENNSGYTNLRDVKIVDKQVENEELVVVLRTTAYSQDEILKHLTKSESSKILWENKSFVVFGRAQLLDKTEYYENHRN